MKKNELYIFAGLHYGIVGHGEGWWKKPQGTVANAVLKTIDFALKRKIPLCWELDGMTAEYLMNRDKRYELLKDKLKKAIRKGLFEIVDGSYSDPYHQILDGESNIRQFEFGREAILNTFGLEVKVYATNEPKTNPQLPQILAPLGYDCVDLSVSHFGMYDKDAEPHFEKSVEWSGEDGTKIVCIPNNGYYLNRMEDFNGFSFTLIEEFPPLSKVEEWLKNNMPVKKLIHMTPSQYLKKLNKRKKKIWKCPRNDSRFAELWAIGHYSGWVKRNRNLEASLIQSESLDALSRILGHFSSGRLLKRGWKYHLSAQHHDEVICEISRISDNNKFKRINEFSSYMQNYGLKISNYATNLSLDFISKNIESKGDDRSFVVVNTLPVKRRDIVKFKIRGNLFGKRWKLKDRISGETFPVQVLKNGCAASLLDVPAFGYSTFSLVESAGDDNRFVSPKIPEIKVIFDELFSSTKPVLISREEIEVGPVVKRILEKYVFKDIGEMEVYYSFYNGIHRIDIDSYSLVFGNKKREKHCFRIGVDKLGEGHVESDYPFFSLNPVDGDIFFGMHFANFSFELSGESLFLCNRDSHVYWRDMKMKSHQKTGKVFTPLWVREYFDSGERLQIISGSNRHKASTFVIPYKGEIRYGMQEVMSGYYPLLMRECAGNGKLPGGYSGMEITNGFCSTIYHDKNWVNVRVYNPFPDEREIKVTIGNNDSKKFCLTKAKFRTLKFRLKEKETYFPEGKFIIDSATPFIIKKGKISIDSPVKGLPWKPKLVSFQKGGNKHYDSL